MGDFLGCKISSTGDSCTTVPIKVKDAETGIIFYDTPGNIS